MKIEEHELSIDSTNGFQKGAPVEVRLNANLGAGLKGFVINNGPDRLRLKVHQATGSLETAEKPCLDWDVSIPWPSIAFVLRIDTKPVDCACREGL